MREIELSAPKTLPESRIQRAIRIAYHDGPTHEEIRNYRRKISFIPNLIWSFNMAIAVLGNRNFDPSGLGINDPRKTDKKTDHNLAEELVQKERIYILKTLKKR